MTTFIGVDPGMKGGIVAILADGRWLWAHPMPLLADDSVDFEAVYRMFRVDGGAMVCIEKAQSAPGQGIASTFKYGTGYGGLIACATIATALKPVLVQSPVWKKEILAGLTHDKAGAIAFVHQQFYGMKIIRPGCRKPCDGMADAACIAEYARRRFSF
jgi:crossover junction endodeoxyribonuclease RuvC